MGVVKYKYALTENNSLVDIAQVNPKQKETYKCLSCGDEMVAALGQVRKHYFRHKNEQKTCSKETYLHYLGKITFYETYKTCLETHKDYRIHFKCPRICTYCPATKCDLPEITNSYSLTNHFKFIELEKVEGEFIPDVLLKANSDDKIFIEIAVTHFSSSRKLASGEKIIEIGISNEDDLSIIRSCHLNNSQKGIKFFNFRFKPIEGNYPQECPNDVHVFMLFPDGSSRIKQMKWYEYEKYVAETSDYYNLIERSSGEIYRKQLELAFIKGHKVKNCFLCRYHGKPTRRQFGENEKPVFCKYLKKRFWSNDARNCDAYRPDKKVFEHYR